MSDMVNAVDKRIKWNKLLVEVIDETLNQIFSDKGTKVIYDFLEKHANLKLEDFVKKPEVFSASLERLMVSATPMIEQIILKNLYTRLGVEFEEKQGYQFADYLMELRGKY